MRKLQDLLKDAYKKRLDPLHWYLNNKVQYKVVRSGEKWIVDNGDTDEVRTQRNKVHKR